MTASHARPRTAAAIAASVIVAGFAIATHAARAHGCGNDSELITLPDRVATLVRPADCAVVLHAAPQFTWPEVRGADAYTIALTFPDGHTETRSTKGNWFAWDRPVPVGPYAWHVAAVKGSRRSAIVQRSFVVDTRAAS
jgi:hypothetical protein